MTRYVYIGSATGKDEGPQAEGIFVYRMDPQTGRLEKLHAAASGVNPSFLTMDPEKRYLFCVNESLAGGASAFAVNRQDGSLSLINQVQVGGEYPCYVSVSPDAKTLLIANYGSGSLAVFGIGDDGRLSERKQLVRHEGAASDPRRRLVAYDDSFGPLVVKVLADSGKAAEGVVPERQERTHAHSVLFDPSGGFVLAADLGMDWVWVYRLVNGRLAASQAGQGGEETPQEIKDWPLSDPRRTAGGHMLKPGSGPRHLAFHPNGRFMYVSNELSSTAAVFSWDAPSGRLSALQVVSTLPEDYHGRNDVAHIAVRPDGRFVYVSNRGHNSIAVFAVDPESGQLSPAGHYDTLGNWPRNFCIDPEGKFLLAANQESETVVVFRIDPVSGGLEPAGHQVSAPTPFFVMVVDLD